MIDYTKYPKNWLNEIRPHILERAQNKCEWCGVDNYAVGARDKHGVWHDEVAIHAMSAGVGDDLFGDFPDMIKIVLTIAHIDNPDPMDCRHENLAALCQRCHLNHDRAHHLSNAKVTRWQKRKAAIRESGQLELPL